jgi:hypothetical protein
MNITQLLKLFAIVGTAGNTLEVQLSESDAL